MKLFRFALPLLMLLCSTVYGQEVGYEQKRIGRIDLQGNTPAATAAFEPNAVRAHLMTQTGQLFSQESFDQDLKRLTEEFDTIEPSIEMVNNELFITLKITPKQLIHSILLEGNQHISKKDLEKKLGLKLHKPLDRKALAKGLEEIRSTYLKKGYFESQVDFDLIPVENANQVDLKVMIKEGRNGKIKKIKLHGFNKEEKSEVLKLIATKTHMPIISLLNGSGIYRDELIERDRLLVLDFLQNRGYADAEVDMKITNVDEKHKSIAIEITAVKGELYHFGPISFNGNTLFDDSLVEKRIALQPGENYSPEALANAQERLKNLYGAKGYIEAAITYKTVFLPDERRFSVIYNIIEGDQFYVGMIRTFGNTRTQDRVIRHETLLVPGQTFDYRFLKATEQRLTEMDYFSAVSVYPAASEVVSKDGKKYRDVHIEVKEKDTGKAYFGVGVSTNEGFFGMIKITEENFNAVGFKNLFSDGPQALRGGGETATASARLSKLGPTYSTGWTKPHFLDTPWLIGFDASYSRLLSKQESYRNSSISFMTYAIRPLNQFWRFRMHYRLSHSTFSQKDSARVDRMKKEITRLAAIPAATRTADETKLLNFYNLERPKQEDFQRVLHLPTTVSAVGAAFIYQSTNSYYKPTQGYHSEIMLENSNRLIGAKQEFIRTVYENTYYQPLWKNGTLVYRWNFEFIQPTGKTKYRTLSLSNRLFMGGADSVRGFDEQSIGPKFDMIEKEPKGGRSSNFYSVQYRHAVLDNLDLFTFVDAGSCSPRKYHLTVPSKLSMSAGVGLSFEITPKMPITVGFGFPFRKQPGDDIRRFFLSLGITF